MPGETDNQPFRTDHSDRNATGQALNVQDGPKEEQGSDPFWRATFRVYTMGSPVV